MGFFRSLNNVTVGIAIANPALTKALAAAVVLFLGTALFTSWRAAFYPDRGGQLTASERRKFMDELMKEALDGDMLRSNPDRWLFKLLHYPEVWPEAISRFAEIEKFQHAALTPKDRGRLWSLFKQGGEGRRLALVLFRLGGPPPELKRHVHKLARADEHTWAFDALETEQILDGRKVRHTGPKLITPWQETPAEPLFVVRTPRIAFALGEHPDGMVVRAVGTYGEWFECRVCVTPEPGISEVCKTGENLVGPEFWKEDYRPRLRRQWEAWLMPPGRSAGRAAIQCADLNVFGLPVVRPGSPGAVWTVLPKATGGALVSPDHPRTKELLAQAAAPLVDPLTPDQELEAEMARSMKTLEEAGRALERLEAEAERNQAHGDARKTRYRRFGIREVPKTPGDVPAKAQ